MKEIEIEVIEFPRKITRMSDLDKIYIYIYKLLLNDIIEKINLK